MNERPSISVLMSVYNGERYLAEAIESIQNQTFRDFEFIIINDGSRDGSLAIIKSYMVEDDRIILLSSENRGLPASLNDGLRLAKGKYIARMDADDISLPERFSVQYSYLENNPTIDVLGTNAFQIDVNGRLEKRYFFLPKKFFVATKDKSLKSNLLFSSCFIHPTVMIRRSSLTALRVFYDPRFKVSQDYELWCRLARYSTFENLRTPLLKYRVHEKGITKSCGSEVKNKNISIIIEAYMSGFERFHAGIHLGVARLDEEKLCSYRVLDLIYYFGHLLGYTIKRFNVYGTPIFYFRFCAALKIMVTQKVFKLT